MKEVRGTKHEERKTGNRRVTRVFSRFFLLVLLALLAFLSGCGKKGPLVPPEALVPSAIDDLRVVQRGELFEVSWSRPGRKVADAATTEATGFRVMRREVLPPNEDCERCPDSYRLIRDVDLEYLKDISRQGNLYTFKDTGLTTGTTYQYKVVSVNREGVASRESNKPRRKKVPPPPPPRLQVALSGSSLLVSWDFKGLPETSLLVGYNVYRQNRAGVFVLLVARPLADFSYRDETVIPATEYRYIVRSVANVDGEQVESEPSNEAAGIVLPPGAEEPSSSSPNPSGN